MTQSYKKVKKEPTPATDRKALGVIRELEKKTSFPGTQLQTETLSQQATQAIWSSFQKYAKRKSLHPVVSCIDSLTYPLTKYVNTLISPLAGKHHPSSRAHGILWTPSRTYVFLPTEVIVSFDLKSLFTVVSVQEALEVTRGKLMADEMLGERTVLLVDKVSQILDLCLWTRYFLYKGEYNQQKGGVAIGSHQCHQQWQTFMWKCLKIGHLRPNSHPGFRRDTLMTHSVQLKK